ncbi:MAG TPA: fructose-1,6-bisphosphatase [Clostridium sp.]
MDLKYIRLLSKQYPTIAEACTEIINLEAILNLPKGTEHFLTDVHGEHEQFVHVLKNGSGVVKRKVQELFQNSLMESEKKSLATLIYYPEQKLDLILKEEKNIEDWYKIALYRLIEICRYVSSKYTRSKVRKALPKDFAYIIEELLHDGNLYEDKKGYYDGIINAIIKTDRAREFIVSLSKLIQRLIIDKLHILGDIYDRGSRPDIILDTLMEYHSIDIQWGNHDIIWMAAAAGVKACVANALRISARYSNLDIIEDVYGISILPLATFALEQYKDDPCQLFLPKDCNDKVYSNNEKQLIAKIHKAIAIIQFKLEGEIIDRRPEFEMEHRLLLNNINFKEGSINIKGENYKLMDDKFPTIDPENPYKLTTGEETLIEKLCSSFVNSEKLQKHVEFLFAKGSMYLKFNSNLLFHGCIPLNEDGSFRNMLIKGKNYCGKKLFDRFDTLVREGYFNKGNSAEKLYGMDIMWYLWIGPCSPLFGKEEMATFERYFIEDNETHIERKNPYYRLRESDDMCDMIFEEFGLDPQTSHIINGHVPIERKKGESPIKCNGRLLVIDGGFSRAYQEKTGIAGYTLIYNSMGLQLVAHNHFKSTEEAIINETDILSTTTILEKEKERKRVRDTDIGVELQREIEDLEDLLTAYRKGLIKEKL